MEREWDMKALFITGSDFSDETYGGAKCSIRNHLLLSEYFTVDTYLVKKKSSMRSVLSAIKGYFPPIDETDLRSVKKMYLHNNYELVFLDGSQYGAFIDLLDENKSKIVVFYHNCEQDYMDVRFGKKWSLKKAVYSYLNNKAERISTNKANLRIALSKRDADRIYKIYGRKVEHQLPLSIVDKFEKNEIDETKKVCLLFGPVGTANIEAFEWFVKSVSPYITCKTVVAGKGFEEYKNWENEKVTVIGYVDSIAELYNSVCCVAIPLFSGGGMKIKTAEAMMFGKTIFGTDEAFEGYELDYNKIGALCNDAPSFISSINNYLETKECLEFNQYARGVYLSKYSVQASENLFSNIMNYLGFRKE